MASTRLTSNHRSLLFGLVDQIVDCPAEIKAAAAAYDRAMPIVKKIVQSRYLPEDMKVFQKDDLSSLDKCVRIQIPDGSVQQFTFLEADAPRVPTSGNCRSRMYTSDAKAGDAIEKCIDLAKAREEATGRKRAEYYSFIMNATTFEQVVDVWPEAMQVASRIKVNLPAAVSPEMIERIKTDSANRMKHAAKAA